MLFQCSSKIISLVLLFVMRLFSDLVGRSIIFTWGFSKLLVAFKIVALKWFGKSFECLSFEAIILSLSENNILDICVNWEWGKLISNNFLFFSTFLIKQMTRRTVEIDLVEMAHTFKIFLSHWQDNKCWLVTSMPLTTRPCPKALCLHGKPRGGEITQLSWPETVI